MERVKGKASLDARALLFRSLRRGARQIADLHFFSVELLCRFRHGVQCFIGTHDRTLAEAQRIETRDDKCLEVGAGEPLFLEGCYRLRNKIVERRELVGAVRAGM